MAATGNGPIWANGQRIAGMAMSGLGIRILKRFGDFIGRWFSKKESVTLSFLSLGGKRRRANFSRLPFSGSP